jgi:hypothetical protein
MVDTCTGLDLGRLPYHHLSIYETSPRLVHRFIYLMVIDYLERVRYRRSRRAREPGPRSQRAMPTRPHSVSLVKAFFCPVVFPNLSLQIPLGISFLRATHSAMMMTGNDDETLVCQRLGAMYRVNYRVPFRADNPLTHFPLASLTSYGANRTVTPKRIFARTSMTFPAVSISTTLRPFAVKIHAAARTR